MGKRILIWPEQGFGDVLQFSRYISELQAQGASVIFEVMPALKRLMQDSFPNVRVVTSLQERGDLDFHCPLMSLPLAFSTTLETLPGREPYLRARPLATSQFCDLFEDASALKVGLVWAGGTKMDASVNSRRNIGLQEFKALNMADVSFFSLQKGETSGVPTQASKRTRMEWSQDRIRLGSGCTISQIPP